MLQRRFPRAGYWFGMLPTHPFIHGSQGAPQSGGLGAVSGPPPCSAQALHPHLMSVLPPPSTSNSSTQYDNPPLMPVGTQPTQQPSAPVIVPSNLTVSLPLNTGVVGGRVSRVQIRVPLDISFEDFFSRVCAKMDLDPADAELGYKYHNDRVRDAPHLLSDAQQLHEALERGSLLMQRARSRQVVLEIHNLRKATQAASASHGHRENVVPDNPLTTMNFASQFRELKNKLACAQHPGKHCYVNPISADHEAQDIYKLSLWAKKIFLGEATYERPPETVSFDHVAKRRRTLGSSLSASESTSNVPAIHVHLPPTSPLPLSNHGGHHHINSSTMTSFLGHWHDDDEDEFITYPPITDVLQEMDYEMPLLNMAQYEANLLAHGIAYVNGVIGIVDNFFIDVVGMPIGVVRSFLKVTNRLIQRAKKGKAKAGRRYHSSSDKENDEHESWRVHSVEI